MSVPIPREIVVVEKGLTRHYWAINRDIEVEGRFITVNRSADHCAVIRLRLEIDFADAAVLFVNAVDEHALTSHERQALDSYIHEIICGIREVLPTLSPDTLQIRALKITLTGLRTHPVDTQLYDFNLAAVDAMTKGVRAVGLSPGPL